VIGGFIAARMLAQRRTKATGALDFLLLASVALPGVVFGAGYQNVRQCAGLRAGGEGGWR
jgi:ABC-type Fe3+ transport system permease subunit